MQVTIAVFACNGNKRSGRARLDTVDRVDVNSAHEQYTLMYLVTTVVV